MKRVKANEQTLMADCQIKSAQLESLIAKHGEWLDAKAELQSKIAHLEEIVSTAAAAEARAAAAAALANDELQTKIVRLEEAITKLQV